MVLADAEEGALELDAGEVVAIVEPPLKLPAVTAAVMRRPAVKNPQCPSDITPEVFPHGFIGPG